MVQLISKPGDIKKKVLKIVPGVVIETGKVYQLV